MHCQECNAPLQPGAFECAFCRAVTPEGFRLKSAEAESARKLAAAEALEKQQLEYERQQAELREAAAQRAVAQQKLKSSGTGALIMGVLGFIPACGVVFSIVGILMGVATRSRARRLGLAVPNNAIGGIVLGTASLFVCGGLLGLGGYLDHADKVHRKELRASIDKSLHDETLAPNVACALTELQLLETKHEGYSASSSGFTCGPHLAQTGAQAVLGDSEIEVGGTKTAVFTCFERDPTFGMWKVAALRADAKCGDTVAKDTP